MLFTPTHDEIVNLLMVSYHELLERIEKIHQEHLKSKDDPRNIDIILMREVRYWFEHSGKLSSI